jgi:tetratricopeptide (TPR) repeat protein
MIVLALLLALTSQTSTPPPPPSAVAARATKARLDGKLDQAILLYRQALKLSPKWAEGWYFLGTIYYEKDQPRECVHAMGQFTRLAPNVSSGYAILGLCLYQAKDYAGALTALNRAERIGLPRGEPLTEVASYHAALLYTRDENFERALQILNFFSDRPQLDPKIIEAAGIAALRKPIFPQDLPVEDRALVFRTGRAVLTAGARHIPEAVAQFADIVADYPTAPNLHFVYGSLLVNTDPDRGVEELRKELALQPKHLPTLVLLGLEYIRRGEWDQAAALGEQAVAAAPTNFTGHVVYGRALAEGGKDLSRGIYELELASRLEPTSPQVRIALASAYAKAGRREEAAAQRAEFQRLKKQLEGLAK